jgi:hypothetical protein
MPDVQNNSNAISPKHIVANLQRIEARDHAPRGNQADISFEKRITVCFFTEVLRSRD